jgi:UPF0755 protein
MSTGVLVWQMLRPVLILLISVALVWLLGSAGYRYVVDNYFSPVESDTSTVKTVQIKAGSSLSGIATQLHDEGIIRNKLVFQLYVDFNDNSSMLQAGPYDLSPGMTIEEIMNTLVAGPEVVRITFTEGMTAADMADSLVNKGVFDSTERSEFLTLCNDTTAFDDYSFIAALPDTAQADGRRYLLEGYLFPDTYDFYTKSTPEDVIRKLLNRFSVIFKQAYEARAAELGMTVDQIVTLASIIEWEAQPSDFQRVSAVFYNRLNTNMSLGSDATLSYIYGTKKLTHSSEERAIESPYNTYKIKGLPIAPISNPGKDAIVAALNPDQDFVSDGYLYFCNMRPDSTELAFARTLAEHNANKAAYNAAAGEDTYDTDDEG